MADAAAIGIWRNGRLLRHRVLTGYTVRKQQGKAQLSYQRQGGGEIAVVSMMILMKTHVTTCQVRALNAVTFILVV